MLARAPLSRRTMLRRSALGFGSLGLYSLLQQSDLLAEPSSGGPLASKRPHFAPRAKRIIFLFMHGGVSHVDTFDPKPRLDADNGKPLPIKRSLTFNAKAAGGLMRSPWEFKQRGESGIPVSELFPEVATCADDLCVIRSMVGEGVDHGAAMLQLFTGTFSFSRPSMGAWTLYGLGTENRNLPGFITIKPTQWQGGDKLFATSFLPGAYQGTPIGSSPMAVDDIIDNPIDHVLPQGGSSEEQRLELEFLRQMNRRHADERRLDPDLEARIQAFELAFRMQAEAPEAFDVSRETDATRRLYGLDEEVTRDFGWQCLLARRLSERGVRVVQATHSGAEEKWDHHGDILRLHPIRSREVDKPIAGLIKDLKTRGLLEETLVVWGSEFGRTPFSEGADGRDHNPYGFSIFMAGGGVKPGSIYGATDEFGYHAVEDRMHIHDLHATILHLVGLDHEKLTYRYSGRDFRLTDVAGVVAEKLLA
ncbi:MAG: DUF1501 domain-containing protein [Acidobacteriia bacterium]|nr:DUF1501 domain-containing protein [Terriglobia bacterium]MYG04998.1 DUF1501 domain-containing protein [Terriglobia bacterium]MYK11224.1 DUF1501 domain-containing protein [Terriglobia bacterium]